MLSLFAVLLAACGVDPADGQAPEPTATNTPEVPLTITCFATEAYPNEHLVAVTGEDSVPTRFDAINGGGCTVSEPITQIRVTLSGDGGSQVAVIDLPEATVDFGVPLTDGLAPTLLSTLQPGRYERQVSAVAADGREVEVEGFEPVILVYEVVTAQAELLRAQSRWERSGLETYVYTYGTDCFCLPEYRASVDVEVQGSQVLSVTFADPEFTGEVPDVQRFTTINELFDVVQDGIDRGAYSIRAEYNEQFGYPVEVFIDYEAMMADEEHGFHITDLRF